MVEKSSMAKAEEKSKVQLFFACLLAPLAFAGLPRFCLTAEDFGKDLTVGLTVGLTVVLALGKAESVEREVAVGFSKRSL